MSQRREETEEMYGDLFKGAEFRTKCPNCSSANYIETISREYCRDCGLECDYWDPKPNKVYEEMMRRNENTADDCGGDKSL